ncbi:NUDIX hydrolase [Comamonadaceae bacterium OH2545_COT-014]|nr:NUDIX hydrolase [Comamonadaceae bacterium OH2545_COT-014]
MQPHAIKHCRQCGALVEYRVPDDGDTRPRAICPACGTIHYQNPLIVVGTVPHDGQRVLLCKRNIEPRRGKWTLPAGFMELGETMREGAARETAEEAGAPVEMGALFSTLSVPRVGQVHVFYLARLTSADFSGFGHETQEVRLFTEADVPWDDIAFATVRETLRRFFADCRQNAFGVHEADIH